MRCIIVLIKPSVARNGKALLVIVPSCYGNSEQCKEMAAGLLLKQITVRIRGRREKHNPSVLSNSY